MCLVIPFNQNEGGLGVLKQTVISLIFIGRRFFSPLLFCIPFIKLALIKNLTRRNIYCFKVFKRILECIFFCGWCTRRACTADDFCNLFRTMYLQIVRTISSIIKSFLLSIPTNRFGIFLLQVQNFVALNSNGLIIHFLICSVSPYECSCWYRMSFNFRYSICNINRIKNLQVHPLHSLCLVSVYSFLFFFAFHWNRK